MKKIALILIAAAFIAGSCTQTTNKQKHSETATNNFVYVSDSLKINEYLMYCFYANIPVIDSITDKLLLENIYAPTEISTDDYSEKGLQKALLKLNERYFSEIKADDWSSEPGFAEIYDKITMNVFSRENNFMTVIYTGEGYAGGAHGYYQETYKVFDLKNKQAVLLENIIENPEDEAWDRILKDELAAGYENGEDMLYVDTIPLNDNFCFDEEGITFVYNQYEIAPYSAGIIYIYIPFNKIEKLLMPDFAKLVLQN